MKKRICSTFYSTLALLLIALLISILFNLNEWFDFLVLGIPSAKIMIRIYTYFFLIIGYFIGHFIGYGNGKRDEED